jgi:hypothetical protein
MKLEISIPTSLKEITLEQYQRFTSIAKSNPEGDFLQHKMIEIFCNVSLKEISLMKLKDINAITNKLGEMFNNNYSLIQTFKHKGLEFGFIPNLDEISLGEYTDLETYISDWDNMNKAMAVLYRPVINKLNKKYLIEEYKGSAEYSEAMLQMPLDVALGAMVFFYHLGKELLISTLNYLEKDKALMDLAEKHSSEKNGVGIAHTMVLVREILEDLTMFPNLDLQPV